MKANKILALFILLISCSLASGLDSSRNLDLKWRYAPPSDGVGFAVADLDGDGIQDVVIGLYDNTIQALDSNGNLKFNTSLENGSKIGKIYAIDALDVNGDGKAEIVAGTGGLKVMETFPLYGFTVTNSSSGTGSLTWEDKVLYRTIRYMGYVNYLDSNAQYLWKRQVYNSVLDINIGNVKGDSNMEIIAGVGDYGVDIYSENGMLNYTNTSCEYENITEEYTGYEEERCHCSGCYWDSSEEECLRNYTKEVCETVVSQIQGKVFVEYPIKNGTAFAYNLNGVVVWNQSVQKYNKSGSVEVLDPGADNNVRVVYAADVNLDGKNEILIGSDAGVLYVYNVSGLLLGKFEVTSEIVGGISSVYASSFNDKNTVYVIIGTNNGFIGFFDVRDAKPKWVSRLSKSVEAITVFDIESDNELEVIAGSTDGNIYVYDKDGINEWSYSTGSPIYYLNCLDMEGDGYAEVVTGSLRNVTLYGMNIEYVLRQSAGSLYDKADEYYNSADYTVSMIYAAKAKDIYLKIKDPEGITKCDVLIKKISDEFKSRKKFEADTEYDRALASYARNDVSNALVFLDAARQLYVEVGNEEGVDKCDSLKQEIEKFIVEERNLEAEGHYSKALTYLNFRNYTLALDEARTARSIYDEINFYNGTVISNKIIMGVADAYLSDSQKELRMSRFNSSLIYAETALQLYNETGNYDGTAKSEVLLQEIKRKMAEGPVEPPGMDYNVLVSLAVGVVVILVLISVFKRRGGGGLKADIPTDVKID